MKRFYEKLEAGEEYTDNYWAAWHNEGPASANGRAGNGAGPSQAAAGPSGAGGGGGFSNGGGGGSGTDVCYK